MTKETIQNVVNGVLATAVVVLFILHFTCRPKEASPAQNEPAAKPEIQASGDLMPLGLINVESVYKNYTLTAKEDERLLNEAENEKVKLAEREKALQKEYETLQQDVITYQKKAEAGAFMSRERAESEAAKLEKKREALLNKQQKYEYEAQQKSAELMNKQAALAQQFQDTLQAYLNEYNADGHLHLILNDAVLMNKVGGYDITNEVIDALNARYKK